MSELEAVREVLADLGMPNLRPSPDVADTSWRAWLEAMGELPQVQLCPRCASRMVKRSGKFGQFIGCTGYPDCKYTRSV